LAVVIAENLGVPDINLEDLGVVIPGSSGINLTDTYELYEITASNDLKAKVSDETVAINDGLSCLSKEDGLKHISIETEYENLKSVSICQVYDNSGITDCNSGTTFEFDGESFKDPNYTHSNTMNADRIGVNSDGLYKVHYNISHINQSYSRKNVRVFCTINDLTMINPSLSYAYSRNTVDKFATNSATFFVELDAGDFITLVCERAGSSGSAISEAEGCWLIIEKVRDR
jgi:hypothetical protein